MKKNEEETLLAKLYLNLGTRRKKDNLLEISEACKILSKHYGSQKSLAKKIGVSSEIIRGFVSITELPNEIKTLIKKKKIHFDTAQRIHRINDKELQIKVANLVAGMSSDNAKQLIQYARRHPHESLENIKKRLITSRGQKEKYTVMILPLPDELYSSLSNHAKNKEKSTEKLIIEILENWINK